MTPVSTFLNVENQSEISFRSITLESLTELFATTIMTGIVTPLIDPAKRFYIPIAAVVVNVVNVSMRFFERWALRGDASSEDGYIRSLVLHIRALAYTLVDVTTRALLTHELCHFLALKALFTDVAPTIEIDPFISGTTYPNGPMSTLTNFGLKFGLERARLIVVAAGPVGQVISSTISLVSAQLLVKTKPTLGYYTFWTGTMGIAQNTAYALSALTPWSINNNDFTVLQAGIGLHPAAAAAMSVAFPLLVCGSVWAIQSLR